MPPLPVTDLKLGCMRPAPATVFPSSLFPSAARPAFGKLAFRQLGNDGFADALASVLSAGTLAGTDAVTGVDSSIQ